MCIKMRRYILFYNTGKIVQQDFINETFLSLVDFKVLTYIIDNEKGQIFIISGGVAGMWYSIEVFEDPSKAVVADGNKK